MKSLFNKFVLSILDMFFLKKFYFFKFKFFKSFLQIKIILNIVDFDNVNYKFIESFVRFIFSY